MGWFGAIVIPPETHQGASAAASTVPLIDVGISDFPRNGARDARIYTKSTWNAAWTLHENVHCDEIHHRAGSQIGTAVLTYRSGEMLRRSGFSFAEYPPLEWNRQYVKIEFETDKGPTPYKWFGVTVASQRLPVGGTAYDQRIECRDLKWLLTRRQISGSYVRRGGMSKRIEQCIPFNMAGGGRGVYTQRGNRTTAVGPEGVHLIDETLDSSELWRASDIIQYALQYFPPQAFNAPPMKAFVPTLSMINWLTPSLDPTGMTLFELINTLVSPTRGAIWSLAVDETIPQFIIYLHSFVDAPITMPGGILEQNINKVRLELEDKHDAQATFNVDQQRHYEQVIVRGSPRTGTGTFSINTGELVRDWTSAEENTYKEGYGAGAGQPELAKARHDISRHRKGLERVYTAYRLRDDWDGKLNASDPVCPLLDDEGEPTTANVPLWQPGLKWLPHLPLLRGVSYEDINAIPPSPDAVPIYLDPFVTFDVEYPGVSGVREFGHRLQSSAYTESVGDGGLEFTTQLSLLDGLIAAVVPTAMAHTIALGSFDATAANTFPSEQEPQLDFRKMKLTASVEFQDYCEGLYPKTADIDPGFHDQQSIFLVHVGDRARLDWVAKGTVVDLEFGSEVIPKDTGTPSGFFVRDDRDYVTNLARVIYQWYATPRQAVNVELIGQINSQFELGDMVVDIDGDVINAVVTGISWDFIRGNTSIVTEFADLDFAVLA